MKLLTKEDIKEQLIESVKGAASFEDMMDRAAIYVQEKFALNADEAEVIDDDELIPID